MHFAYGKSIIVKNNTVRGVDGFALLATGIKCKNNKHFIKKDNTITDSLEDEGDDD